MAQRVSGRLRLFSDVKPTVVDVTGTGIGFTEAGKDGDCLCAVLCVSVVVDSIEIGCGCVFCPVCVCVC